MAIDGGDEGSRGLSLKEALNRLAEAELVTAILEARLLQYQNALEAIHGLARKSLEA